MAATLPPSILSSRRNSIHREENGERKAHSRRTSLKGTTFSRPTDDKIAVQDSALLAASQDADSMKFPVSHSHSESKQSSLFDTSFGDFGKSLIDDDYLKGFGLAEARSRSRNASPGPRGQSRGQSRAQSRGHSRGNSRGGLMPPDTVTAVPTHSIYELDVPQPAWPAHTTPEKTGFYPVEHLTPNRGIPKQSLESARVHTYEQTNGHSTRKGNGAVNTASPESPVKVKRLSGFSLKSVRSAFSRNDYPEVVQPTSPTRQPRRPSDVPRMQEASPRRSVDPPRQPPTPNRHDPMNQFVVAQHSAQFAPRQPRAMASTPQFHPQTPASPAVPRPWMTRRPSAGSLRSTMSNINKPLPPEPGQMKLEMLHPRVPPTPSSRTPTSGASPSKPWQEPPSSPANNQLMQKARRANTAPSQSAQLRSRYTPKDLDALDDAFQRSTPAPGTSAGAQGAFGTTDPLDPIRESPRASQLHLDINAPLQISRGPMRMEPSRRPPPTPGSRSRSPVSRARSGGNTPEPSKQSQSQTQTQLQPQPQPQCQPQQQWEHVAAQTAVTTRRPSAAQVDVPAMHLGGGPTKVQQLLGESGQTHEGPKDPERSTSHQDAYMSSNLFGSEPRAEPEQPTQPRQAQEILFGTPPSQQSQPMTRSESIQMTRSESFSSNAAGAFRTGTSDVQFNEIRRRLELLSPTTAADTSFMTSQIVGQILSNQVGAGEFGEPRQSDYNLSQPEPTNVVEELPAEGPRVRSMAPVELPTEANWSDSLAGLYEMAGFSSPRVSVQPATPAALADFVPPPIPESPKRSSRVRHSHTQSMLSSGSGRTKSVRSMKSARSARSAKARSITSAAASEIPELYAGLPSPRTTLASRRPSVTYEDDEIPEMPPMPEIATTEELEERDVISADVAEQVLYQILRNLACPKDLFNASLVSRGFQRTFTRHDTKLLRNALWYSSPPCWEYLEMHMPISETGQITYPPSIYREQWLHSMKSMGKLKAMILHHCRKSLNPITAVMLDTDSAEFSAPVDDAIWRIWTFCKIFGEDEDRREDLELQKQWIKGHTIVEHQARNSESRTINAQDYPAFGFGNDEGLSPDELMRIGEIWLCLRVLVKGYRGQRREAREFGIFEGSQISAGDAAMENAILDEWTIHLLSLAPGTNLDVLCPQAATSENFITAESLGFTSWTPPGRNFTSSGFLTGPICTVLEEWLANDAQANARPSQDEGSVHPAFRTRQNLPARQQIGMFVDRLRTVRDVLVLPKPEQKIVIPSSAGSMASSQSSAQGNKNTPGTMDGIDLTPSKSVKSTKEGGKKAAFAGFSSKLSLRLPSRSHTTAKQSKAPPIPSERRGSEVGTAQNLVAPASENVGLFGRSKSTASKGRIFLRNPTKKGRNGESKALATRAELELDVPPVPSREGSRGNMAAGEKSRPGSMITDHDKLPVFDETLAVTADPDATNPTTVARARLIALGYDANRIDDVLEETTTAKGIDFARTEKKLKKSKRLEDRLRRLDTMG